MSDVSKTNELADELRERAMIGADVDPIDAARLLNEAADALEAASRVPVQGEPTEAQVEAAAKAVADAMFPGWHEFERVRASKSRGSLIRKAGEAALVAAADAAPQAGSAARDLLDAVIAAHAGKVGSTHYESCYLTHAGCLASVTKELLDEAAQPSNTVNEDALADVIEQADTDWNFQVEASRESRAYSDPGPKAEFTARAVAELPETGLEVRDGDGDLIMSGEHRKVLHQGMYVCDSCVNDLGLNVRWDRAGFMEGHPLPVEGESK